MATLAYAETKRLFLRAGSSQLQSQLEDSTELARVSASADAQEGIPQWSSAQPKFSALLKAA